MNYPLTLTFKTIALAPQISVTDADGRLIFYVKQQLFKLKEAVNVFADKEQTNLLFTINADRIIDFSAQYHFRSAAGADLGSVKKRGMKSLWKAHYDIFDGSILAMEVGEENPWIKLLDGIFSGIPVLGMFSGYVFHPTYLVSRQGSAVMRIQKLPAFFEGRFEITKAGALNEAEETRALLSLLMMALLEKSRG